MFLGLGYYRFPSRLTALLLCHPCSSLSFLVQMFLLLSLSPARFHLRCRLIFRTRSSCRRLFRIHHPRSRRLPLLQRPVTPAPTKRCTWADAWRYGPAYRSARSSSEIASCICKDAMQCDPRGHAPRSYFASRPSISVPKGTPKVPPGHTGLLGIRKPLRSNSLFTSRRE